jgi:hypothetical protein
MFLIFNVLYIRHAHAFLIESWHQNVTLPGNATNNLWVQTLTINLFDIRQAELQPIITLSILL